jgi:toxoflavin biosynthesis protein ToxD
MTEGHVVDITNLAVLGEQFPLRLMQLGFRLMQVIDEAGRDQYRYVIPPMCEVPAGPFLMGSAQRQVPDTVEGGRLSLEDSHLLVEHEYPLHDVTLPTFHISKHPLTVTEYACFMQATQHREPSGSNPTWQAQQAERADHPVVYIFWNDVLAYARWLTQVTGDQWRLPTEAKWEKAARGTEGRFYPWGDLWDHTRANTIDGGPGTTTAVGSYPNGASPYGVQDMAGNVWEWTSTILMPYPYQANDGREDLGSQEKYKVQRGGSWGCEPLEARAAYRKQDISSYSSNDWGVRLVRGDGAG